MKERTSILTIPTSWGPIVVQACEGKVVHCDIAYANGNARKTFSIGKSNVTRSGGSENRAVLKSAESFVRGLFDGKFKAPPAVEIPSGTAFQRKIWKQLYKMKPGQTLSYGEMARIAGSPKAFRAAGQACGANKIPLFIPCHRVVTSSGKLGGFSCGLPWKEKLLEIESGGNRRNESSRRRLA